MISIARLSSSLVVQMPFVLLPSLSSCPGAMYIFVKIGVGKTITLNAEPSETIASIKVRIQSREGIHPSQQLLMFGGRDLEDGRSLAYYHIQNVMTLQLAIRHPVQITTTEALVAERRAVEAHAAERRAVDVALAAERHAVDMALAAERRATAAETGWRMAEAGWRTSEAARIEWANEAVRLGWRQNAPPSLTDQQAPPSLTDQQALGDHGICNNGRYYCFR